MTNEDLDNMSQEELKQEVIKLRTAIRTHRDQKSDENCFLDDEMYLYGTLPENTGSEPELPDKQLMMYNCTRYYECRKRKKLYVPLKELPPAPTFGVKWYDKNHIAPKSQVCVFGNLDGSSMFFGINRSKEAFDIVFLESRHSNFTHWFPLPKEN